MQRREERGRAVGLAITLEQERFTMRHNTLYGMLLRGWRCITAFGRTPVCLNIPRLAQNRAGFEVAKEEEAEKMTGRGGGGNGGPGEDGVAAAVKERLGYGVGDKGRQ